jgi:TPR repeat protein
MTEKELKELKELAEAAKVNADSGDKDAQYNLGNMFYNGQGVAQDYNIAVYYYTLAANAGHIGAMFRLADIYRYGRKDVKKNEALANTFDTQVYAAEAAKKAAEAQAAADMESPELIKKMGDNYYKGVAPHTLDFPKAVTFYEKAANAGHIGAMMRLADIYRNGRQGVEKNEALAKTFDTRVYAAEAAKKAAADAAAAEAAKKAAADADAASKDE